MPKELRRLSDTDLKLMQAWAECIRGLNYARGENKIILEFLRIDLEEKLKELKLLDIVQYLPTINSNNTAVKTPAMISE